jgi:hypothetical protein
VPFEDDSATGLGVLIQGSSQVDVVSIVALAAAGILSLVFANHRHPADCPCPNCDPPATGRTPIPMSREQMLETIAEWGLHGPPSITMGHHDYDLPAEVEQHADSAQMALARHQHMLDRRAFVDRLYLELTERNPELASIPIRDPRARHWVVVGALSKLPPKEIEQFVKDSTG